MYERISQIEGREWDEFVDKGDVMLLRAALVTFCMTRHTLRGERGGGCMILTAHGRESGTSRT